MKTNLISFCVAFSLLFGDCVGDGVHFSMFDLREIQQELSDVISKAKSLKDLTEISEREDVIKERHDAFAELVSKLITTCKNLQEKVSRYQKKYEKYKDRSDKKKDENIKLEQLLKSEQGERTQEIYKKWFDAAKSGNYKEMKELVDQIPEINHQDERGNTVLIVAAEGGYENIVELLLRQSFINVNTANKNGRTPLSAAIVKENKNIVKMLVEKEAKVTKEALSIAVELENKEIVEILLNHYSSPDRKQVLKKILKDAIEEGNDEMVSLLTEKDAYVGKVDEDGMTPLMDAANSGEIKIIEQLLGTKAEANEQDASGLTALMYAVNSNMSSEAIVKLLAQKVGLNIQDQRGWTALMHAANNPDGLEKMKVLLENKADVSLKNKKGQTALDIAKENLKEALKTKSSQIKEFEDIVKELKNQLVETHKKTKEQKDEIKDLRKKLPVQNNNKKQVNFDTTKKKMSEFEYDKWMKCAEIGNGKCIKRYIADGYEVDVHYPGRHNDETALERVASLRSIISTTFEDRFEKVKEVAELLLKNGADPNIKNGQPLYNAIVDNTDHSSVDIALKRLHQADMVELLLKYNADPNTRDPLRRKSLLTTALDEKWRFNGEVNLKLEKLLIEYGADKNTSNSEGKTVLMYAAENGDLDFIKLLLMGSPDPADIKELLLSGKNKIPRSDVWISSKTSNIPANINAQDKFGNTALMFAVNTEKKDAVRLLLDHRANVNIKGIEGKTALMLAVEKRCLEIVELLLKYGADATDNIKDCNDKSTLDYATEKTLLDYEPDIEKKKEMDPGNYAQGWSNYEYSPIPKNKTEKHFFKHERHVRVQEMIRNAIDEAKEKAKAKE